MTEIERMEAGVFATALGLVEPWYIKNLEYRNVGGLLEFHITVDFRKGAKFPCPVDGCKCTCGIHDTVQKTWRHANFFQFPTYIHARVPRTHCPDHMIKVVSVPWARPGSGFTILFEALALCLAKNMPVRQVAEILGENDTTLWNHIRFYVDQARDKADFSETKHLGVDETSKKGHRYITVFANLFTRKVLDVEDGKDKSTISAFVKDFVAHKGRPEAIKVVSCDMSLGFLKGIEEAFPNATPVIDKFHVVKHANEAVDMVRKQEAKDPAVRKYLLKTKYLWLTNPGNLTAKQSHWLTSLIKKPLKTGRAYVMKLTLQSIYERCRNKPEAKKAFLRLISWLRRCRLEPMKQLGATLKNHLDVILNYWPAFRTNALLEGLNSVIQNIKNRARGFRNVEYFKTMIYLVCGQIFLEVQSVLSSKIQPTIICE